MNAKIRKIAIMGCLSAGKSTVLEMLAEKGAYVVKSDDIVHNLLSSDKPSIQQVVETFGESVLKEGLIDRKALAHLVFGNNKQLQSLEAILHPKLVIKIKETYQTIKDSPLYKAFAVEIPVLFKTDLTNWFDLILYVKADKSVCKERFLSRGFSEDQFEKRWAHLASQDATLSDLVIDNSDTLEPLKHQLKTIL